MSKLTETLKKAGWVETTLGECQMGDEVLLGPAGPCPRATRVAQPAEWGGGKEPFVNTSDGGIRRGTLPVLRPPRPEYEPGTVALIRIPGGTSPVRASRYNNGWIHERGWVSDMKMLSHGGEVVRVLLPADQDTPPITDEMVERAAEACYLASFKEKAFSPQWDGACERFPEIAARYRQEARAALEAALGVEK